MNFKSKLENYFKSNSYEKDLDALLGLLQKLSKQKVDFSNNKIFNSRVQAKAQELKRQVLLAIIEGAKNAAAATVAAGQFQHVGDAVLITVGTTTLVILITAAGIVIKRMVNGVDDPNFAPILV